MTVALDRSYEFAELSNPSEGIAHVAIDRQTRLNAIHFDALNDLDAAIRDAEATGADVVVLSGNGRAFSRGADTGGRMFENLTIDKMHDLAAAGQEVIRTIRELPIPTIAAIEGYCLGGGMELALACDLRVADETSTFGQPEQDHGFPPVWGGTSTLQRTVGESRAKEIIFSRDNYDAETMKDYGFVNYLVEEGKAVDRAVDLAERMAEVPGLTHRYTKEIMHQAQPPMEDGFEVSKRSAIHLLASERTTMGLTGQYLEERSIDPIDPG